jgi:hypothetical protein
MFHKLPSEIEAEDAYLLKLLRIEALGKPPEPEPEGGEEWPTL